MEDILVLVITEGQPIFIGKCGKIRNIFGVLKKKIFQVETLWKLLNESPTLIIKVYTFGIKIFFSKYHFHGSFKKSFSSAHRTCPEILFRERDVK